MSQTVSAAKGASEILAAAGIEEDWSYYGSFTQDMERVVLTVPMRIQAAWAANDADRFADVFTSNGSLLMRDEQLTSREEIRDFMSRAFQGPMKGARVKGWPLSITFLGGDVAVVITGGGIIMPGEADIARERRIRATWVVVALEGGWKLMSHQSSLVHG